MRKWRSVLVEDIEPWPPQYHC